MRTLNRSALMIASLILVACVTINIYFPEAAAEEAADRIIDDVWGHPGGVPPTDQPRSGLRRETTRALVGLANWIVPAANAASVNIDISTPAIDALIASMRARHRSLAPFYTMGVVGQAANGLVAVRDLGAAAVKDRKRVNDLVSAENRDRDALYAEIARANGHPEWENDIRATFARRWVERAAPAWWYQDQHKNWLQR